MQIIYLYNEDFIFLQRVKNWIKRIVRRQVRGPAMVFESLCSGLASIGQEYRVNARWVPQGSTVCVVSGVKVLQWAIIQKKRGLVTQLLAGPNIVVSPADAQGVLSSEYIDSVLVPSEWVGQFYMHYGMQAEKIKVWAAGVLVHAQVHMLKQYDFLLYDKAGNEDMIQAVQRILKQRGFSWHTLKYGTFMQSDYYEALTRSKYLLYISPSESQGLAMFEAWARDVPSLHWERGFYEYKGHRHEGHTATPYVHPNVGMVFKDVEDFSEILSTFVGRAFFPRQYILHGFTQTQSAQHFLEIVNSFSK